MGGVTPGREGEHLALPVLPTVRKARSPLYYSLIIQGVNNNQAMEVLKPDATGIYVASHQATAAIEEAIEAEVPLIVAVAERKQPPKPREPTPLPLPQLVMSLCHIRPVLWSCYHYMCSETLVCLLNSRPLILRTDIPLHDFLRVSRGGVDARRL